MLFRSRIFSGGFIWDRRDDPVKTTRGEQASATMDVAVRPLGSEVGFVKTYVQASIFRSVVQPRRITFAGRVLFGVARGFAREAIDESGNPVVIDDLPASHRLFAGGSTTVRGFQVDRLGVEEILNPDGLSNGGNGLIVFNGEVRTVVAKLLDRDVTVVAFVDAGNVFHRASDLDLGRLRVTPGAGIRWESPLGPIRFDVGFKTDPQIFGTTRERRWEFHLSIGEVF